MDSPPELQSPGKPSRFPVVELRPPTPAFPASPPDNEVMNPSQPNQPVEWLCACLTIPTQLFAASNQTEPLQSLVWMIANGPVLGSLTLEPGQVASDVIAEHFREVTHSPLIGEPHRPTRIRVATQELAEALREAIQTPIEIVCAPTPEFEALLEGMTEYARQRQPTTPSYLASGASSELMAAFFRATATLYAAQPWSHLPADLPILVDAAALSLKAAALIVMGHGNREYGFLLFASERDFRGFLRAAKAAQSHARPPMPVFALDYSRGADIPLELRKEATSQGWQVAGANAYPGLTVLDSQFGDRSPTQAQFHQAEALSLALAEFARSRRAARAQNQPPPATADISVQTHRGTIELHLTLTTAAPDSADEQPTNKQYVRPRSAKKRHKY